MPAEINKTPQNKLLVDSPIIPDRRVLEWRIQLITVASREKPSQAKTYPEKKTIVSTYGWVCSFLKFC
ncbi:MAG: hypothetical protein DK303_001472 [Chloroflexi bacterium]|jgi:hypothetical protein|nr:MAG: hypothetical protein DK303_001472 [Chloroflexota bacterium]